MVPGWLSTPAVSSLCQEYGFRVVTQNWDNLYRRLGCRTPVGAKDFAGADDQIELFVDNGAFSWEVG